MPEPESTPTDELLDTYARLSLERDELAAKVAQLERELASHWPPADAPRRSRVRSALLWLAVVLTSAMTLGVVVGSASILAGFWDPLGNDETFRPGAASPRHVSGGEPRPVPARALGPRRPPQLATSPRDGQRKRATGQPALAGNAAAKIHRRPPLRRRLKGARSLW
jgi:hypothetical protein